MKHPFGRVRPLAVAAAVLALPIAGTALAEEAERSSNAEIVRTLTAGMGEERCPDMARIFADQGAMIHELSWTPDYEGAEPERYTLIGLNCMRGAYNVTSVWFMRTPFDEVLPVAFAAPATKFDYADKDEQEVSSSRVIGFDALSSLVNADFDPETQTMNSFSKWRGLGDAFSAGTWRFRAGGFTLETFVVDPTFDGKQDPLTVYSAEETR